MSRRLLTAALLAVALSLPSCWNGSYNVNAAQKASGRFLLTIEPSRTDVDGTHFLVDSANGDLWRLEGRGAAGEWVRLADAPEDAADLAPQIVEDPEGEEL